MTIKIYEVHSSPYPDDKDFPWVYHEEDFVEWVGEVFLQKYKHGGAEPLPSAEACYNILVMQGYTVVEVQE